ncbi:MAG: PilZ domain-containing protein [candidate division Zixibacteria bacterium]|nr:PilZ domain-containing protein [candidate division Zixibacteria bacterium]
MPFGRAHDRKLISEFVEVYDRRTGESMGHVVDLTYDGLRLFSNRPLIVHEGLVHQLRLVLPTAYGGEKQILVDASGVWCEEDTDVELESYFHTGFRFLRVSAGDNYLIERLMTDYTFPIVNLLKGIVVH